METEFDIVTEGERIEQMAEVRKRQYERRRSVNDHEFELKLERLMKQDLSAGTEAFCEDLLGRCLSVLDADNSGAEIPDEALDLLAAAGDPGAFGFFGLNVRTRIDDENSQGQ